MQPCGDRLARIERMQPGVLDIPEWEVALAVVDALSQEQGVHPFELGVRVGGRHQSGNSFAPRERLVRPHDAEDVRRPGLHVIERERAEIADVDDLQRVILRSGSEHPAARRGTPDPVREPIRRVVRAHDVAGPDDQAPAGERVERLALARHLQRPVGLVRDLLRVRERRLVRRGPLVATRGRVVGVDGQGRDERVAPDRVRQQTGRVPHHARDVATRVDRGVPRATGEALEPAVAVAVHVFDLREPLRLRRATVEHRHLMSPLDGVFDDGATDEVRPSDHQQLHRPAPPGSFARVTRAFRLRHRPPSGP